MSKRSYAVVKSAVEDGRSGNGCHKKVAYAFDGTIFNEIGYRIN